MGYVNHALRIYKMVNVNFVRFAWKGKIRVAFRLVCIISVRAFIFFQYITFLAKTVLHLFN